MIKCPQTFGHITYTVFTVVYLPAPSQHLNKTTDYRKSFSDSHPSSNHFQTLLADLPLNANVFCWAFRMQMHIWFIISWSCLRLLFYWGHSTLPLAAKKKKFKILFVIYQALKSSAPHYLCSLVLNYTSAQQIHSLNSWILKWLPLKIRQGRKVRSHCFNVLPPYWWKELPMSSFLV